MKKIYLFFLILLIPLIVFGNPMSWPYLPASDYFRGTAGERLFYYFQNTQKGTIHISNDFRFYSFKNYWDASGETFKYDKYSRLLNIFCINYNITDRIQLSTRIPYVKLKNARLVHAGLSDIFIGLSYAIKKFPNADLFLSSGLKIPTGYYDYNENKLLTGTGSFDVPLIITSNLKIKDICLYTDIGYIFIGKSDILYSPYDRGLEKNNGDEIFLDFAFIKQLHNFALKFEINYYNVFNSVLSNGFNEQDSQSKLGLHPGLLIYPGIGKSAIELGFSYDLIGKNVFSGFSPVIRLYFNAN